METSGLLLIFLQSVVLKQITSMSLPSMLWTHVKTNAGSVLNALFLRNMFFTVLATIKEKEKKKRKNLQKSIVNLE